MKKKRYWFLLLGNASGRVLDCDAIVSSMLLLVCDTLHSTQNRILELLMSRVVLLELKIEDNRFPRTNSFSTFT